MNQEKDSPAVLKTVGFQTGQPLIGLVKNNDLTTSC